MLKAVLCDLDGTLLDSNHFHAEAWQRSFAEFGIDVSFEDAVKQIGKGADQVIPYFVPKNRVEELEKPIKEFRKQLFHREYMDCSRGNMRRLDRGGVEAGGGRRSLSRSGGPAAKVRHVQVLCVAAPCGLHLGQVSGRCNDWRHLFFAGAFQAQLTRSAALAAIDAALARAQVSRHTCDGRVAACLGSSPPLNPAPSVAAVNSSLPAQSNGGSG